ncbi:tetraspanin-1-like isoform X1 [Gigantopelta aegis]|uniref:tetraspanin-1-like isoform X1 n=1 Tax=Gigantopelta aegis TaxID=1735272 RepID=UPI001B88DC17|nr:tetraspanin-1-like isoform X1 [Gigantopelta aegis]
MGLPKIQIPKIEIFQQLKDRIYICIFCGICISYFILGMVACGVGVKALEVSSGMAGLATVRWKHYESDPGLLRGAASVLVTGAVFLFVAGFLGLFGIYKKNRKVLKAFNIILVLLVLEQVVAGLLAVQMKGDLMFTLQTALLNSIENDYDGKRDSESFFSRALDYAQIYFECCGINSYTNFEEAKKWPERNKKVAPLSCCILKDKNDFYDNDVIVPKYTSCKTQPDFTNSNIGMSCLDDITEFLVQKTNTVIGIAFSIVMLEVVGVMMAITFGDNIQLAEKRKSKEAKERLIPKEVKPNLSTNLTEVKAEINASLQPDPETEGHPSSILAQFQFSEIKPALQPNPETEGPPSSIPAPPQIPETKPALQPNLDTEGPPSPVPAPPQIPETKPALQPNPETEGHPSSIPATPQIPETKPALQP